MDINNINISLDLTGPRTGQKSAGLVPGGGHHGGAGDTMGGRGAAAVWADRWNVPLAVSLRTNRLNQNKNHSVDPDAMQVGTEHINVKRV